MVQQYDLIVIGSGVAASAAASRCRAEGWNVAVVDRLPFGGTCALRGCDPKKVLVGAVEAVDHANRLRGKGIAGGEPVIDWRALISWKRSFTDPVPRRRDESFAKSGIEAYRGTARFTGPNSLSVDGENLRTRFVLIAAGAAPMRLGVPGEELLKSSADFLDTETLPRRIVLVGGGFIAAEFAHIAARSGAQVAIIEQKDRMLTHFDPDLADLLMERTREIGVDLRLGSKLESIEKAPSGLRLRGRSGSGDLTIDADLAIHAAGRAPDLVDLDLAAAGVETEGGRLRLNNYLQSVSNPAVYAAGDAAGKGPPLTPVAGRDGSVAAANMLHGNHQTHDYHGIPRVVFTIPPLARVGMLEQEAREAGRRFRVHHEETADWHTARRLNETAAAFKTLIEEDTGRILGVHLLGPNADDVINLFALAMRAGLTIDALGEMIPSYPTASSDISYMLRA